ncbi:hypothetical protein AKJ16_DCAP06172 [Drosera capensis]
MRRYIAVRHRTLVLVAVELLKIGGSDEGGRQCRLRLSSHESPNRSYLSHLSLFLAYESKKFYILVDNRPWLDGLGSKPAHFWQLMVTKSRMSPFANTRARKGRKDPEDDLDTRNTSKHSSSPQKNSERWFSLIDSAALSQKKAFLPMKKLKYSLQLNRELHRTLFGLIVFEVSWNCVRGINYVNELQTDTSLALESKFMKRWEFDSIVQAASCLSSWFSGTDSEQSCLREYLLSTVGKFFIPVLQKDTFYDAEEDFASSSSSYGDESACFHDDSFEDVSYGISTDSGVYPASLEDTSIPHTPPPPNLPYKRRKVTRTRSFVGEGEGFSNEVPKMGDKDSSDHLESTIEATEYKDILILFRFKDGDLPFRLRDIIVSDLRLLTLLEAGLPSWVIFLQSYPVLCKLYKPWMCPLARVLYVLVSVVTVLIGFYDLYKNVPLLKATASHLFGPLFDWIETWEMVSRVKYLGTVLFLHHSEKAIQWFLMITRTMRSFFSVIAEPMMGPLLECAEFLLPIWSSCINVVESVSSFIWAVVCSSSNLIEDLIQIIVVPIWFILSALWSTANFVLFPIFWGCREVLYAPLRLVMGVANLLAFSFTFMFEVLEDLWSVIRSIFRVASATETTYEATMRSSLWKELFSQVFRAIRSILNGFVAFFAACNRHRLSIYNHLMEFLRKLSRRARRARTMEAQQRRQTCGSHNLFPNSCTYILVP